MNMKGLYLILLSFLFGCNLPDMQTGKEVSYYFDQPAQIWEETLPLGNGRIGMMPDGGIRFQAARGDGSIGFQLGEQVGVAGGWLLEVDVPCSALGDNIGVPIAVLFTLIVLLSVANNLVRNGKVSDTGAVNTIISCQGHPSFRGSEEGDGDGDALPRKCNNPL